MSFTPKKAERMYAKKNTDKQKNWSECIEKGQHIKDKGIEGCEASEQDTFEARVCRMGTSLWVLSVYLLFYWFQVA